jgi:hypothetical protein
LKIGKIQISSFSKGLQRNGGEETGEQIITFSFFFIHALEIYKQKSKLFSSQVNKQKSKLFNALDFGKFYVGSLDIII